MYEYVKQEKAPIQRKVGFEFQGFGPGAKQVYKVKEGQEARTTGRIDVEKPGNGDVLGKIGNIKVTADGYNLEYVTPAYDEHDARQRTSARNDCRKAAKWHCSIPTTSHQPQLCLTEEGHDLPYLPNKLIRLTNRRKTYYIQKTTIPHVHPQASLGVRFQAIPELFRSLSAARQKMPRKTPITTSFNPLAAGPLAFGSSRAIEYRNKSNRLEIIRNQFERFQKISQDFQGALSNLSPEGQALAQILAQMAYMTNLDPEYSRTSKTVYAVMPRTSPGEVYHRLPVNEKRIFQKALNSSSTVVLSTSEESLAQELRTYLTQFGNVMVPGPSTTPPNPDDDTRLTLSGWLTNVTGNIREFNGDVHTLGEINTANLQPVPQQDGTQQPSAVSKKYGGLTNPLTNPFDIGNGKEGMILELRALPRFLSTPEQWGDVVEAVMNLAYDLNFPPDPFFITASPNVRVPTILPPAANPQRPRRHVVHPRVTHTPLPGRSSQGTRRPANRGRRQPTRTGPLLAPVSHRH